ncbi:MAG: hypothetical protein R3338_12350, partial [Thermoanaerobaculia bacterium]|nr:hypothetical protein [Thermoanaerobaculia bacterium]
WQEKGLGSFVYQTTGESRRSVDGMHKPADRFTLPRKQSSNAGNDMKRTTWWIALLALLVWASACDRKPEDLEVWRNAEGGFQKMVEWASSAEEPIDVRQRAVQILIEEHRANDLHEIFTDIDDAGVKKQLVDAAVPTVEKMWNAKDWPKIDKEGTKGGLVKVEGASESVAAKDAAYFLQPHAEGASKEKLEAILTEWMSEDQDIRTQLGVTTIPQIAPRAGADSTEMMISWLENTKTPSILVDKIMALPEEEASEELTAAVADAVRKRCEAEHPDLSPSTEGAMLRVAHENMAPYLERAIADPESPTKLVDGAMDVYVKSMGDRATPFFVKLVDEKSGLLRWVAATRLIEIRGKAGVLAAAKALPLEPETYAEPKDDSFKKESEIFCNFVSTELKEQGVDSADDIVANLLKSDRWPAQVLGLRCAEITASSSAKPLVDELTSSKTMLPGWGEKKTMGELASEVSSAL